MKKKTVLILLSLLHICVFCIGILILVQDRAPRQTALVSNTVVDVTTPESETPVEVSLVEESSAEDVSSEDVSVEDPPTEKDTTEEASSETAPPEEPAPALSYTFQYVRGKRNLNIRNAPSMQAQIIGKIPPGQGGNILEFADEDWALIEYRGQTGYSSLHWMELTPAE